MSSLLITAAVFALILVLALALAYLPMQLLLARMARAVRALGEAGDLHVLSVLRPLTRSSHPFVAV